METNVNFLLDLANHPEFQAGNVHTNFIPDYYDTLFRDDTPSNDNLIQASVASVLWEKSLEETESISRKDCYNPFVVESNYRINHKHSRDIKFLLKDKGKITFI